MIVDPTLANRIVLREIASTVGLEGQFRQALECRLSRQVAPW